MALFRTFIAVAVAPQVRTRVAELTGRLRNSGAKVSWTNPIHLHLTLKFLGDTPDAKLPDVCRGVAQAAARASPFVVTFQGAGAFPRAERPRTVWIGVTQGQDELRTLQLDLEEQLFQCGFARERRRYTPHLTIGRVRGGGPTQLALGQQLLSDQDFAAGQTPVAEVLTLASFLDSEGPTYQVLGRASLDG